jgi:hypothetical protein
MSVRVQRFVVKAHPSEDHPKYYRWQTATVCVFVGDDDKQRAFKKAMKIIAAKKWVIIEIVEKGTLIEDRVRSFGGEVWEAYQDAQRGKIKFIEGVDQRTTDKDIPPLLAPKITEIFVDSVVIKAGGYRFIPSGPANNLPRNADYIIDDFIFDLKILQEESLEITATQTKLAELFKSVFPNASTISLDPALLPPDKQAKYFDIIRKRVQRVIHSASDQVRSTKKQIGNTNLKGGVILVNSGSGLLLPGILEEQAERCIKQSSHIECFVCLSVWLLSNGFDSIMNFKIYPVTPQNKTVEKLTKAFGEREEEMMNHWASSGFTLPNEVTNPMKPVAFERDGIIFNFVPPQIPDERFKDNPAP